jgi:galactose mutarotase-like enzyme
VSGEWSYRGFQALVLENDRLRVTVLPGHGAKITEFVSKRAGRDLLYHHPRFDVRPPFFGANADDWWTGGIDEVAPTGHPCVVNGEQLPFLGEYWSQAWSARVVEEGPERAVVDLAADGIITPLRIERRMELRTGEAILRSRHRLTNVGREPIDFMWGIHPGLAIRPGARIQVPATEGVFADGHPQLDVAPGMRFAWPRLPQRQGGSIDLSVARAPDPPSWELAYLDGLSAGWLAVTDPLTRSGFAMSFDPAILSVAWLWGVYGGWRGIYALALEAWTSYPARLDQAIAAGRQRTLGPGEVLETEVRFIAYEGLTSVRDVAADGQVAGE